MIRKILDVLRDPALQAVFAVIGVLLTAAALLDSAPSRESAPTEPRVPTTAAATPSATNTPAASAAPPSPTPAPVTAFPCEAQVNPASASSVINLRRDANETSPLVASVRRGDTVTLLDKRSTDADVFYLVEASPQRGWVAQVHLIVSSQCP